ncbi:MAG: hypothetical protein IJU35_04455 [Paludibacteraceae bacterium]|nr:hypothetical protein [Paludibacteraceae bacterium]
MKKLLITLMLMLPLVIFAQNDFVDLNLPSGTKWSNVRGEQTTWQRGAMPTVEQWRELYSNCTWKWIGGGYKVVGSNGNSIFLPIEGYIPNGKTSRYKVGGGYYWTSNRGEFISFDEKGVYIQRRTTSEYDRLSWCEVSK